MSGPKRPLRWCCAGGTSHSLDGRVSDEGIGLLTKTGSIDYASKKADELIQDAWDGVKGYIPNNKYKGYLKSLAEFFVNRKK